MAEAQKQAIIVGGPNGAGKTTFVEEFLRDLPYRYIGADLIAAEIAPDHPESVAFDAGREFMRQIERAIAGGENVIVETTLSGKSFRNVIQEMRQRNYYVSVQCIFLKSPESHIIRVAERVRGGGHHVPDDDVIRRFTRSLRNFWQLYRPWPTSGICSIMTSGDTCTWRSATQARIW
jgi:predicted ABC-type ATPase